MVGEIFWQSNTWSALIMYLRADLPCFILRSCNVLHGGNKTCTCICFRLRQAIGLERVRSTNQCLSLKNTNRVCRSCTFHFTFVQELARWVKYHSRMTARTYTHINIDLCLTHNGSIKTNVIPNRSQSASTMGVNQRPAHMGSPRARESPGLLAQEKEEGEGGGQNVITYKTCCVTICCTCLSSSG